MATNLDAATLRAVRVDLRRELNALVPHDNSPYAIGFDNGVLWAIDRVAALADAAAPRPVAEVLPTAYEMWRRTVQPIGQPTPPPRPVTEPPTWGWGACGAQAMQGHICSPPPPAEAQSDPDYRQCPTCSGWVLRTEPHLCDVGPEPVQLAIYRVQALVNPSPVNDHGPGPLHDRDRAALETLLAEIARLRAERDGLTT